jgi:hypothetical protein
MTPLANNEGVVRRVAAVVVSLAVQASFLGAPVVHAHPDDHATGHHHGRSVHSHWTGHGQTHDLSDTPSVSATDRDRAVFVGVFVAVMNAPVAPPTLAPAVFTVPVPVERASARRLDTVRSHDPPYARSLSSRAPPAVLS